LFFFELEEGVGNLDTHTQSRSFAPSNNNVCLLLIGLVTPSAMASLRG